MAEKNKAATERHPAAAEEQNTADEGYRAEPKSKNGRSRYVRLFPERIYFLLATLTPAEVNAYLRILVAYVVADGKLPADDKALAALAHLKPVAWAAVRDRLIELGVVRVQDGWLVDDDQAVNLEIQRAVSARQSAVARRRWSGKR